MQIVQMKGRQDGMEKVQDREFNRVGIVETRVDNMEERVGNVEGVVEKVIDVIGGLADKTKELDKKVEWLNDNQNKMAKTVNEMRTERRVEKQQIQIPTDPRELEQLTGMRGVRGVLFDSMVDTFDAQTFFKSVRGKKDIFIVTQTGNDDVFGVFVPLPPTKIGRIGYNPEMVLVSLFSNDRCLPKERFGVNDEVEDDVGIQISDKSDSGVVFIGVEKRGGLWLGGRDTATFCTGISSVFERVDSTMLTGTRDGQPYQCERVVVFQLE